MEGIIGFQMCQKEKYSVWIVIQSVSPILKFGNWKCTYVIEINFL